MGSEVIVPLHERAQDITAALQAPNLGAFNGKHCSVCLMSSGCQGHFGYIDLLKRKLPIPRPEIADIVIARIAPLYCALCSQRVCGFEFPPDSCTRTLDYNLTFVQRRSSCLFCSVHSISRISLVKHNLNHTNQVDHVRGHVVCYVELGNPSTTGRILQWSHMELYNFMCSIPDPPRIFGLALESWADIFFEVFLVTPAAMRPAAETKKSKARKRRARVNEPKATLQYKRLLREIIKNNVQNVHAEVHILCYNIYMPPGKDSRLRCEMFGGNTVGARVTIVSGGISTPVNTVEVAESVAKLLLKPEKVCTYNARRLRALVLAGEVPQILVGPRTIRVDPKQLPVLTTDTVVTLCSPSFELREARDCVYWGMMCTDEAVSMIVNKDGENILERPEVAACRLVPDRDYIVVDHQRTVHLVLPSGVTRPVTATSVKSGVVRVSPENVEAMQQLVMRRMARIIGRQCSPPQLEPGFTIVFVRSMLRVRTAAALQYWHPLIFDDDVEGVTTRLADGSLRTYDKTHDYFAPVGSTVVRQVQDGETVVTNRPPTLKPQSTMFQKLHRIRLPRFQSVMGMSPAIVEQYAGDYDGDELFLGKSRNEALCQEHLFDNRPFTAEGELVSLLNDAFAMGLVMLSCDEDPLPHHCAQMLLNALVSEEVSFDVTRVRATRSTHVCPKLVLECVMPDSFDFDSHPTDPENPKRLLVRSGRIVRGNLMHQRTGRVGSWFFELVMAHPPAQRAGVVSVLMCLAQEYLLMRGVSVSIKDLLLPAKERAELKAQMAKLVEDYWAKQNALISDETVPLQTKFRRIESNAYDLVAAMSTAATAVVKGIPAEGRWFSTMCRDGFISDNEVAIMGFMGVVGGFPPRKPAYTPLQYATVLEAAISKQGLIEGMSNTMHAGQIAARQVSFSHEQVRTTGDFGRKLTLEMTAIRVTPTRTLQEARGVIFPDGSIDHNRIVCLRFGDNADPAFDRTVNIIAKKLLGQQSSVSALFCCGEGVHPQTRALLRRQVCFFESVLQFCVDEGIETVNVPFDLPAWFKSVDACLVVDTEKAARVWATVFARAELTVFYALAICDRNVLPNFPPPSLGDGGPLWLRQAVEHIVPWLHVPVPSSVASVDIMLMLAAYMSPHWAVFYNAGPGSMAVCLDAAWRAMEVPWNNPTVLYRAPQTECAFWAEQLLPFQKFPDASAHCGESVVAFLPTWDHGLVDTGSPETQDEISEWVSRVVRTALRLDRIVATICGEKARMCEFVLQGVWIGRALLNERDAFSVNAVAALALNDSYAIDESFAGDMGAVAALLCHMSLEKLCRITDPRLEEAAERVFKMMRMPAVHPHARTSVAVEYGVVGPRIASWILSYITQKIISSWKDRQNTNKAHTSSTAYLQAIVMRHEPDSPASKTVLLPAPGYTLEDVLMTLAPVPAPIECIGHGYLHVRPEGHMRVTDSPSDTVCNVYDVSAVTRYGVSMDEIRAALMRALHKAINGKGGTESKHGNESLAWLVKAATLQASLEKTPNTNRVLREIVFYPGVDRAVIGVRMVIVAAVVRTVPKIVDTGSLEGVRWGYLKDSSRAALDLSAIHKQCSLEGLVFELPFETTREATLCLPGISPHFEAISAHISQSGLRFPPGHDLSSYTVVCVENTAFLGAEFVLSPESAGPALEALAKKMRPMARVVVRAPGIDSGLISALPAHSVLGKEAGSEPAIVISKNLPYLFKTAGLPAVCRTRSFAYGNAACAAQLGIAALESLLMAKLSVFDRITATYKQVVAAWITMHGPGRLNGLRGIARPDMFKQMLRDRPLTAIAWAALHGDKFVDKSYEVSCAFSMAEGAHIMQMDLLADQHKSRDDAFFAGTVGGAHTDADLPLYAQSPVSPPDSGAYRPTGSPTPFESPFGATLMSAGWDEEYNPEHPWMDNSVHRPDSHGEGLVRYA